jgi:DNA-directed RNA polymerase specialized sigma24 family protein
MDSSSTDRIAPIAYLPNAVLRGADDAALARAIRMGDPRAEREAWRRFRPMVFRLALYATGSRAAADDLAVRVLETFLTRAVARSHGEEEEGLVPILLTIAARAIQRRLRWGWLRSGTATGRREATPTLAEAGGDRSVQAAVGRFLTLNGGLSPLARTAFALHYLEAREIDEVAIVIGKPLRATRRLLRRTWLGLATRINRDPVLADILPTLAVYAVGDGGGEPVP